MKGFLSSVTRGKKDSTDGSPESLGTSDIPRADIVTLPSKKEKRKTNFFRRPSIHTDEELVELPLLSETPMAKRELLFRQKLQICCNMFDFGDVDADVRGKELKRDTLFEIAEYVNTAPGQKIFTEPLMPDIVQMVRVNLLRTLPPQVNDYDPEEDEPSMELMWPHLQIVYEFFLRFIVSTEVNGKIAKRYVDQGFIRSWIDLFDAEDPRERDYVKTILHRIYGKFMSYRSSIRKAISQVFCRYIYETGRHNGIAELLEILGSIINGFAIPLKKEHVSFLENSLIPLHKAHNVVNHHSQLSYCISQYVEKDQDTIVVIVDGLIRIWPWTSAAKQVLYLSELQEILEICRAEQLTRIEQPLYRLLSACLMSSHFQVAERALFYWNSEQLGVSLLSQGNTAALLPHVIGPLVASSTHWNQSVESLSQSIRQMYMEMDQPLFDQCLKEYTDKKAHVEAERRDAGERWDTIVALATRNETCR